MNSFTDPSENEAFTKAYKDGITFARKGAEDVGDWTVHDQRAFGEGGMFLALEHAFLNILRRF
uniref:Uncharacterized protein n=1 Tax=Moniliophthora roreri TaxID=221103 RepID=A0A0W0FVB2_MONRR